MAESNPSNHDQITAQELANFADGELDRQASQRILRAMVHQPDLAQRVM